jgi:predicted phage baseplate assembly protein
MGGGEIGNVGLNTINHFVNIEDTDILSFSNPEQPITKGTDPEDIAHAKMAAPKLYRTFQRAVTVKDFEDLCTAFAGVDKAKCIETFNANGDLNIYIVPVDFQTPSDQLKTDLLAYLKSKKLVHDNPIIQNPTYVDFNITVDVVAQSNYSNATIKSEVEGVLAEVYDIAYMDFGEDVLQADIVAEAKGVKGVRNVTVSLPTTDLSVAENAVARLGTVTANVTGGVDA